MKAPRAPGPRPGVLSGGHRAPLPALLLAFLAFLPAAAAGDRKDVRTDDERLLDAVGAEWKASDYAAVGERLPEKAKVSLRLPGEKEQDYRLEQARALIKNYLRERTFSKVERTGAKDGVGTFSIKYARADRKTVEATLYLTLGTEGKRRVLVGARESP